MEMQDQFLLLNRQEFKDWLLNSQVTRQITLIQNHHTYKPDYKDFIDNHFVLLQGMRNYHINVQHWSDIAQNITTFPDGLIAVCRPFEKAPAGIYNHNVGAICIENLGNFDMDIMKVEQKKTIIFVNAILCKYFKLTPSINTIVYHHWFDLDTGKRTNGLSGNEKTCPGNKFFGGNTIEAAENNFITLIQQNLRSVDCMEFEECLKFLSEKCGISYEYWMRKKKCDVNFGNLIIKIASSLKENR